MERDEREEVEQELRTLLREHGVIRAGLFGSIARGDDGPDSDMDVLIEFDDHPRSLMDLVELKHAIEGRIGRNVDLVTYDSIHPSIRERVLAEEVQVL